MKINSLFDDAEFIGTKTDKQTKQPKVRLQPDCLHLQFDKSKRANRHRFTVGIERSEEVKNKFGEADVYVVQIKSKYTTDLYLMFTSTESSINVHQYEYKHSIKNLSFNNVELMNDILNHFGIEQPKDGYNLIVNLKLSKNISKADDAIIYRVGLY